MADVPLEYDTSAYTLLPSRPAEAEADVPVLTDTSTPIDAFSFPILTPASSSVVLSYETEADVSVTEAEADCSTVTLAEVSIYFIRVLYL